MSARILIIDQDPACLDIYRQSLAAKTSTWTLTTVSSASEAIAEAAANAPDIVVAALSLDQGQGLKTLSQIIDLAPLAHAFIAAEESAKNQLTAAFKGGCRYLPHPCPADRLMLEFQRCLAIDSWFESPVVREIVANRSSFQSLPSLYLKVANALQSPNASFSHITEAISCDIALSAKILEAVNSSFHAFDQKISDIHQAASLLGLNAIKNIILAAQVFDHAGKSPEHRSLINELWYHSIAVAGAARRIALYETDDAQAAEEAYTAGLLHDIGKLVLIDALPEEFSQAQRFALENAIPTWKAEIQSIGCDHAEVGGYLLARWGLPQPICETAALHHRPANACQKNFSSLTAVHAANAIVRKRRHPKHLDAQPSSAFLAEIGKSDRWQDWEAIAAGETPPSNQTKLSLKTKKPPQHPAATPATKPAAATLPDLTTTAAHAALSRSAELALENQEHRERLQRFGSRGQNTFLAFAAGIVCCLGCIYFLNSVEEAPAKHLASENKPKTPSTIGARQEILAEILDSKPEPTPVPNTVQLPAEPELEPLPPPPPPPPPPFPDLKLGAIFQRATGPRAQVNGKILGEGDTIDGAEILHIDRISITVEHFGRQKDLTLD